jgi:hypothetical protein
MFEQQILCHKSPNSFNCIKIHSDKEKNVNKRHKIIQDFKRQMLDAKLEQYETKIQQYEYFYEQELATFKSQAFKIDSSYQISRLDTLMHFVKTYVYHHKSILIRRIRYRESCLHAKLIHHHRRRQPQTTGKIIDVYPQILVDVPKVSLNRIQLEYLSHTGKLKKLVSNLSESLYSLWNFSYLFPSFSFRSQLYQTKSKLSSSYKHRQKQVQKEHKNIMNVITPYLVRVYHERYMAPLSYLNVYRARKELKLMKEIQFRIKKENYILRVTDKSGIFHLGHAKYYEQKAEAYRQKNWCLY